MREIVSLIHRFVGTTEFAPGKWVGVELEEGQVGKNNGSVNGKEYFKCTGNRGLFVRSAQLQVSRLKKKQTEVYQKCFEVHIHTCALFGSLTMQFTSTFWRVFHTSSPSRSTYIMYVSKL